MKLNPEGVEKAAKTIFYEWANGTPLNELMAAALTVYFDHLKEAGFMREAAGTYGHPSNGDVMMASTHWNN